MIKLLIITLFFLINLEARENPFFPSDGEKDILYANKHEELLPLKRATIALPTHARVIESVTVKYKNLDGTQDTKTIELDNSIDWHLPIFISQSFNTESQTIKPSISKTVKYTKVASFKYMSFYSSDREMKLVTNDKMIRNFLLVKPHRIVLDFDKDVSMKNYTKSLPNNIFKKIRVGNHSGYYRVVLELDGYYRYSYKKSAEGYTFKLK